MMHLLSRKNLLRQKWAQPKLFVTGTDRVFISDEKSGDVMVVDQHKLTLALFA